MCAYNYLKEIPKATLFEVYAVQCWYISDEFDKKKLLQNNLCEFHNTHCPQIRK